MGLISKDFKVEFHLTLNIDALYFHAARQNCDFATQCWPQVLSAQTDYKRLIEQRDALEKQLGEAADEDNPDFNRAINAIEFQAIDVRKAYNPCLRYMATVHILCAASLEAHINATAKTILPGSVFDSFEKSPFELKWYALPKLIDLEGFKSGDEPFQSFAKLVKFRNALVHYKSKKEKWSVPDKPPEFLENLGLTPVLAERSINTVKGMITKLSEQIGKRPPRWLNSQETEYIDEDFNVS